MNAPVGTLIHVNPAELIIDINVRKDANLTPEFLKSIKQHGVLQPIVVFKEANDSAYSVLMGQRRTLAAIEAGHTTIPAMLVDAALTDDIRIVDQLVENHHRADITLSESASAYKQLALLGVSAIDIARRTNTKMARVGDSIRVADSKTASEILTTHQVTIDDALIFAEFENDAAALESLNETLQHSPNRISHVAQQIRDERAEQAQRQLIIDEINRLGITLIEKRPAYDDITARAIESVYIDENRRTQVTLETVTATAPEALRAYPYVNWEYDNETHERTRNWEIAYAVANPLDHGWHIYIETASTKGPLSDEEKAQRALQRVNGKLWQSATTVRTEWVRELLKRRSLPADYPALAALCFAELPSEYGNRTNVLAHKLLDIEKPGQHSESALPDLLQANPLRGAHILLAIACAWFESNLDEKKGWNSNRGYLPIYLQQLAAWGYTLSELEETIVAEHVANLAAESDDHTIEGAR